VGNEFHNSGITSRRWYNRTLPHNTPRIIADGRIPVSVLGGVKPRVEREINSTLTAVGRSRRAGSSGSGGLSIISIASRVW
jgi:hypothetical protein